MTEFFTGRGENIMLPIAMFHVLSLILARKKWEDELLLILTA